MSESSELPPKTEVALALLQTALSVYVHLDPRPSDVRVPASFKKQAQLVLQVGLNMAVPIPDLDVGADALTCTLSFNRKPEFCWIPWSAIYGLVGDDGRGMIWPDSVPPEVAAAAEGRPTNRKAEGKRPRLRVAGEPSDETKEAVSVAPKGTQTGRGGASRSAKKAARARTGQVPSEDGTVAPGLSPDAPAAPRQLVDKPPATPTVLVKSKGEEGRASAPVAKRELPPYLRIVK